MKEITTATDNFKYFPAGELNREGNVRENSFIVMDVSLVANHEDKLTKGYSAFGILADQLAALFKNGVESVHVTHCKLREKKYGNVERVIQMAHPMVGSKVVKDVILKDPEFEPPCEKRATAATIRALLAGLTEPEPAFTKSENVDPERTWI